MAGYRPHHRLGRRAAIRCFWAGSIILAYRRFFAEMDESASSWTGFNRW